jgi:hypothetical protein
MSERQTFVGRCHGGNYFCGGGSMVTNATASAVNSRSRALKRIQRPFFGDVGLSCAYCEKQALRRGSVGTDCFLKLPG